MVMTSGVLAASLLGCADDARSVAKGGAKPATESGFVGVDPLIFQCESVAPLGAVAQAVGGPVETTESPFTPAKGTPQPCSYALIEPRPLPVPDGGTATGGDAGAPAAAQWLWSLTFDCRDSYHAGTRREMERLIAEEGAKPVELGSFAIVHRDAAILFFDDDSPCWVRVVGPGGKERLALARLVAERLTEKNAPMRPQPAP
jgi:hypothetical protein